MLYACRECTGYTSCMNVKGFPWCLMLQADLIGTNQPGLLLGLRQSCKDVQTDLRMFNFTAGICF